MAGCDRSRCATRPSELIQGRPSCGAALRFRCVTVAVLIVASVKSLHAQQCAMANSEVRVEARVTGTDKLVIEFAIYNRTADSLGWLSIGAAGERRTVAVPSQSPEIVSTPPGWRGVVVYPEETADVHLWWEPVERDARIPPNDSIEGLVVRVAGPHMVRPNMIGIDGSPVVPIDFATLPFTAGGSGFRCWWGEVTRVTQRQ